MKIPNKRELQQIALNHLSDIDFKDFKKFTKNVLQSHINMILIEKLQKISVLSSGKIEKYEYLTGEEILLCNEKQIIEQAKFTYSPLGKAFEKQTKTIEDQGKTQVDA